jgi:replicative superfamily II helicase
MTEKTIRLTSKLYHFEELNTNLAKEKVDLVVLDEIHFVKKRDEESSQRRKNLDGLMTAVRKKNSDVKVLGLSATPVVNNLMEGRSLLELITGKIYDDVATTPCHSKQLNKEVTLFYLYLSSFWFRLFFFLECYFKNSIFIS